MAETLVTKDLDLLSTIAQELLVKGRHDAKLIARSTLDDLLLNESIFDYVGSKVESISGYKDLASKYSLLRMIRDENFVNSPALDHKDCKIALVKKKDEIIARIIAISGLISDQALDLDNDLIMKSSASKN